MTLADTFDRELAAIPKGATRRYIAERLAKVAASWAPASTDTKQAPVPKVHLTGLAESELLKAEFRRKNARIRDLEDEVAKLKAERGAL